MSQDESNFSDATDVTVSSPLITNHQNNNYLKRMARRVWPKKDCVVEDATSVATIHIWDDLLSKLTTGNSYKFTNLTVKNYSGITLLSTAPTTTCIETDCKLLAQKVFSKYSYNSVPVNIPLARLSS